MNKTRVLIIACTIIAAGFVIFYFANPSNRAAPKEGAVQSGGQQHGQPPAAPAGESPPKSPDAAAKQEPTPAPTIEIPPEKQQVIGVRSTPAAVVPLRKTVRTVGRVEYDERKLTTVNTKVEGWIERLYVNYTGTYVKKGERVADIYSPELWATQQEFINLVRWAKKTAPKGAHHTGPGANDQSDAPDLAGMLQKDAEVILDAARKRLKLWDISDAQIRRIEQSETPLKTLAIASPSSGYVQQKYVVQGQRVMAGERLFDVSDLSSVWVVADIYEYEFPFVKEGDVARIRLNAFPDKEYSSRVEFISPTLSAETRTMKVRFSIPNPRGNLRPQMFADVELVVDLGRRLAVPDEAVIDTGLRKIVYIDKGDGIFEPREVVTGAKADKMVEIRSGLKAGDPVASSANFLVDSEAKLKGIEAPPKPASKQDTPPSAGKKGPSMQAPAPGSNAAPAGSSREAPPPPGGHRH